MSAGKMEDMPPQYRYSTDRLVPMIEQAVKPIWLREILGGFLYRLEQLAGPTYDIAVWEVDIKKWRALQQIEEAERFTAYQELEPEKIWGEKQTFIPRKGEQLQIGHEVYEVVNISYDLAEDYTSLLVVRLR
jgi:hypothetical protein